MNTMPWGAPVVTAPHKFASAESFFEIRTILLILLCAIGLTFAVALPGCSSESAQSLYDQGMERLAAGNPKGAIVYLKNALEKKPSLGAAHLGLGDAYMQLGKLNSAESEYKAAVEQNAAGKEKVLLNLARIALMQQQPDKAAEHAQALIEANPDSNATAAAYEVLGSVALFNKDFNASQGNYTRSLELKPESEAAAYGLAAVAFQQGDESKTRTLLGEVLAMNPSHRKALQLQAALATQERNSETALAANQALCNLNPPDTRGCFVAGLLLMDNGEFDEARQIADSLLKNSSGKAEGQRLQGILLYRKKDYEAAAVALERSYKLAPTPETSFYLGLTYFANQKLDTSVSHFQRVLDAAPAFVTARIYKAVAFLRQLRLDEAQAEAERAVQEAPDNAHAHLVLGSAYMANGKLDKGMEEMEHALEIQPGMVDAQIKRGIILANQGMLDEAEQSLEEAVRNDKDNLPTRLMLFSFLIKRGEHQRAYDLMSDALTGTEDDAKVYNAQAIARLSQEQRDEAMELLARAKEAAPGDTSAYMTRARIFLAEGNKEDAKKEYEELLQKTPDHLPAILQYASLLSLTGETDAATGMLEKAKSSGEPAVFRMLAAALYEQGSKDEALAVLEEGLSHRPSHEALLIQAGRYRLAQGDLDGALTYFSRLEAVNYLQGISMKAAAYLAAGNREKALEEARRAPLLDPDSADGYAVLASTQARLGQVDEALQTLREGWAKDPGKLGMLVRIGDLELSAGRAEEAAASYQKAITIDDGFVPALVSMGMLHEQNQEFEPAMEFYRKALQKDPGNVPALNNLAYICASGHGDAAESLQLALRAYQQDPSAPLILDTLGISLLANDRTGQAVTVLEKAAAQLGDNPTIQYHLARAYHDNGDIQAAKDRITKALELGEFPEQAKAEDLAASIAAKDRG